jgi:hypothetical protein
MAASLTILALFALFMKFGPTFRQAVLGYDILADIILTVLFIQLFASTGTISGMMIAITAGLFVSLLLFIGKKACTSRTLGITRSGFKFTTHWNIHHGYYHNYVKGKHHG